jgi:hypothetical protein
MEWVDHRNLPDRPPASVILNSLEKSQPLVGTSVGIRCELVHIGRILIRIVSKHRRRSSCAPVSNQLEISRPSGRTSADRRARSRVRQRSSSRSPKDPVKPMGGAHKEKGHLRCHKWPKSGEETPKEGSDSGGSATAHAIDKTAIGGSIERR